MPDFPRMPVRYGMRGALSTFSVEQETGWVELMTATTSPASNAWATANLALYVPVIVDWPCRVYKMSTINGATLGGNTDIGIYDADGNRLVSSAPTAQAGVSVIQTFDITDTFLNPGQYYFALANTTTTATYSMLAMSLFKGRVAGMRQQTGLTSGTLPNPAVFATFATLAFLPHLVAHYETVV